MNKKIPIYITVMFLTASLICGCGGSSGGSGGGTTSAAGPSFTASAPATSVDSPEIQNVTPLTANVGDQITITGARFGETGGKVELIDEEYNKIKDLNVVSWSGDKIVCSMVRGIAGGKLSVYNSVNAKSNPVMNMKAGVSVDVVLYSDPDQGTVQNAAPVGATVQIQGSGFGTSTSAATVTFNGTSATLSHCDPYLIICTVPSGAATGNAVVTVSGSSSVGLSFTVTGNVNVTVN